MRRGARSSSSPTIRGWRPTASGSCAWKRGASPLGRSHEELTAGPAQLPDPRPLQPAVRLHDARHLRWHRGADPRRRHRGSGAAQDAVDRPPALRRLVDPGHHRRRPAPRRAARRGRPAHRGGDGVGGARAPGDRGLGPAAGSGERAGALPRQERRAPRVIGSARVGVLGETVARQLFGDEDPLGAEILIGAVRFRVIGRLEPFGTDLHGMDRDAEIVVPISTLQRRVMNVDTLGGAKLLVRDPARVDATAREVERALRERHALASGQPDDFSLITATQVQRTMRKVERVLFVFLPLAAVVALLVGSAVAASLMLASVSARVGEIGLRRAGGARPADVQLQFLLETAATALGGGLLGLLAGSGAAELIARRMSLGEVLSWKPIVLGLGAAALTGFLAGVLPARRAARLEPVDALR